MSVDSINNNPNLGASQLGASAVPTIDEPKVGDNLSEICAKMKDAYDAYWTSPNPSAAIFAQLQGDWKKVWDLVGEGQTTVTKDNLSSVKSAIDDFNKASGSTPSNPIQQQADALDKKLHSEIDGLVSKIKALQSEIDGDVSQINALTNQISDLKAQIAKMPSGPNKTQAGQLLTQLNDKITALQKDLTTLNTQKGKIDTLYTSAQKELLAFDTQAKSCVTKDDLTKLQALFAKIDGTDASGWNQSYNSINDAAKSAIADADPQLKAAQDLITKIQKLLPTPPISKSGTTAYFDVGSLGGTIWQAIHWHQVPWGQSGVSGETLNQDQVTQYFDELFSKLKESGVNKIDCSFCTMDDIEKLYDAACNGKGYAGMDGADSIGNMICEKCGVDSQTGKNMGEEFFKIMTTEAKKAGMGVNLSFGGEDNSVAMPAGVDPSTLADHLSQYMKTMGFTGCDWDVENGVNSQSDKQLQDLHTFWSKLNSEPNVKENTIAIEGGYQNAGLLADNAKDASNIRSLMADYVNGTISATDLAELKRICAETSKNMKGCFSGVNLMLYGQQSYIAAKNGNWGIEGWMSLLGGLGAKDDKTASLIHVGFRDDMDFKDPSSYAVGDEVPAGVKDAPNEGAAAAMIYQQLLANLAKDGYSTKLGSNFFWPQNNSGTRYNISKEGADTFENVTTDGTNTTSNVMSDFDKAMSSYTPPKPSVQTPSLDQTTRAFSTDNKSYAKNIQNNEYLGLENNTVQDIQKQRDHEQELEAQIRAEIMSQGQA